MSLNDAVGAIAFPRFRTVSVRYRQPRSGVSSIVFGRVVAECLPLGMERATGQEAGEAGSEAGATAATLRPD